MAVVDLGIIVTAVNRASATLRRVATDTDKVAEATKRYKRGLRAIDVVLGAIAAGSAIQFAKSVVKTASALEQATVRLSFFERGMDQGRAKFKEIRKEFAGFPIETQTLLDGFTRLKAAGLDPLDGSLKAISEAVMAFGGGTQELNRAIIAIQQIAGKGTLQMEELRQQLGEAVPFAIKIMADETGRTIPEFIEAVSRGMVSSKEAIDAFVKGSKDAFSGYGKLMANTIQGGETLVRQAWEGLITRVFGEGGLDTRIGIFLKGIADKIREFTDSLTEADVDAFVETLKDIVRFLSGALQAIVRFGSVVVGIMKLIISTLGSAGTDILTSGVIGYLVMGKMGAGIFAVVTIGIRILDNLMREINRLLDIREKLRAAGYSDFGIIIGLLFGKTGLEWLAKAAGLIDAVVARVSKGASRVKAGAVKVADALGFDTAGTDEAVAEVQTGLGKIGEVVSNGAATIGRGITAQVDFWENAFKKALRSTGDEATDQLLEQTDSWKEIRKLMDGIINQTKELNVELNDGTKTAAALAKIEKARLDLAIKLQRAKIAGLQAEQRIRALQESTATNFIASDSFDAAKRAADQFAVEIENTQLKILQLQRDMLKATSDTDRQIFQQQIETLQKLKVQLEETAQASTASAMLAKESWESVGSLLSDTVKSALSDVAQGTLDLEQVQRDVWRSITDLAANYVVELAKIKLLEAGLGQFGGGGSSSGASGGGFFSGLAGMFGGMFGGGAAAGGATGAAGGSAAGTAAGGFTMGGLFASGGAFPMGSTLDPGIVRGPTTFGIAGEGGGPGEAVLPLVSAGGKLGVAAAGGGDSRPNLTINLSAIDAQTGTKFLYDHAEDLGDLIMQQKRMNG